MEGDSIAGAPLLPPMGKRARFMLNRALRLPKKPPAFFGSLK